MRLIPIESVKEGSYLARTIFDNHGRVLLREGAKLTNTLIKKIRSINIYSVYVIDEYSAQEIDDVIKPELRQKAIKTIKDTFFSLEKFSISMDNPTLSKGSLNSALKERESYFSSIHDLASELLEELLTKQKLLVNLVDIKSMDNYTYQHSVNVAVLSLVLGLQLQLNKQELYNLCLGALIHDIGKVLIPKEIILKPGKLTDEEFETIRHHALKGYNYLKDVSEVPATARIVALQHHERFDGKGYPEGREGSNINKLARIVAITDVYDALTSDRPYRRAMSPNDAIEYIMASSSSQFDYQLVKAFAKVVIPYPEGTLLRLSNGDYAVVEEVFQNYPLRPKVRIVKSNIKGIENSFIDLTSTLDIVIADAVHNIPEE